MRLVEARGGSTYGDAASSDGDPIPDVPALLADIAAAGLDLRHEAVISFHLRFVDRPGWERAAEAARTDWQVSAYSRPGGHMLQLSRQVSLSERDLERERAAVVAFATEYDAVAESVTVEDLARTSVWQTLAAAQMAVSSEPADEPADPVEQPATGSNIA